jgi:hypothetical protein
MAPVVRLMALVYIDSPFKSGYGLKGTGYEIKDIICQVAHHPIYIRVPLFSLERRRRRRSSKND